MTLTEDILATLDSCAAAFTFPMLDNGYVYLAATRLSVYSSDDDWAIAIEVFGFSPRAGIPDTSIYSFGSCISNRKESSFVSETAYQNYLSLNPNNVMTSIYPILEGDWQDVEDLELVSPTASSIEVRGSRIELPSREQYAALGIDLTDSNDIHVFECCRYLAEKHRELVLATEIERRGAISSELNQLLLLDDWLHPNLVEEEVPSENETFRQLAELLASGDVSKYNPTVQGNTHWSNWPDGGSL